MTSFAMVTLTPLAAEHMKKLLDAEQKKSPHKNDMVVRFGVKKGGCAGMEYKVEVCQKVAELDEKVESQGMVFFIDHASVLFFLGTKIDYKSDRYFEGFVFNNPNQVDACGCGESVTLRPLAEQKT